MPSSLFRFFLAMLLLFSPSWASADASIPQLTSQPSPVVSQQVAPPVTAKVIQRLIIKYKSSSGVQPAQLQMPRSPRLQALSRMAGVQMSFKRLMSGGASVLNMARAMSIAEAETLAAVLAKSDPAIEYVQPDYPVQIMAVPTDPGYVKQWHYSTLNGMNLEPAWNITTGSPNMVAAVLDTGYLPHADLGGAVGVPTSKFLPGYDMIADLNVAGDGNGRDPDPSDPGDWVTAGQCYPGSPARNSSWHGTHVSGTIGALANNGIGGTGVDWQAKILPVRVLGHCGGFTSDIVDGIRWAAGLPVPGVPNNPNKANVINMSLGGQHACSVAEQSAIDAAVAAGVTVVVSAGNSNMDASLFSPASCNNVITVAAVGPSKDKAYYSNFGATVEISAPGGDMSGGVANGVYSTLDGGTTTPLYDNSYAFYQGTSMAAPHISGLVTLMQAAAMAGTPKRLLTPTEVLNIIQNTAKPFTAAEPVCSVPGTCGAGRADAGAAVAAAAAVTNPPPPPPGKPNPPANFKAWAISSTTGKLTWQVVSNASYYRLYYQKTIKKGKRIIKRWVVLPGGKVPGTASSVRIKGLKPEQLYTFRARAFNAYGKSGWSNASSVRVLAKPRRMRCRPTLIKNKFYCTWINPSRYERKVYMEVNTGTGYQKLGLLPRNAKAVYIRFRGFPPGTKAKIRVRNLGPRSKSSPSNAVKVKLK